MTHYYVNQQPQSTGEHEVHADGCHVMPNSKTSLGYHETCSTAVQAAKVHYAKVDGCYHCARPCHTR